MRNIVLCIVLSLLVSINTKDVFLTSGSSVSLGTLSPKNNYMFFLPVKEGQIVEIEVTREHKTSTVSDTLELPVTEVMAIHGEELETTAYFISSKTNKFTQRHEVSNPFCSYLSIEVYPKIQMSSVYITATIKPK